MIRKHTKLGSPHSALNAFRGWAPVVFLIFVFLLGGGARSDLASLPLLRGVAILAIFWAALELNRDDWQLIRTPLLLIAALTLWMVLQLVPLAPSLWQSLPGRETVAAIDRLLGLGDHWRPISLTPSLTLNSVLAMSVPIAALLLAARIDVQDYPRLLFALVGVAVCSGLLGMVQILTGPAGGGYLYRITNVGEMVGLFANRNHHAVFLACSILIAAMLLRDELMRKRKRPLVVNGLAIAGLFLTAMTVLVGSRAGFAAGLVAFGVGYMMVVSAWGSGADPAARRPDARAGQRGKIGRVLLYAPPVFVALLFAVVVSLSTRTTALTRVVDQDAAEDLRVRSWSTVQSMIETYWTTGSGFGSFAETYKVYEPDRLLQASYFNHAHNDWAELVLTGGLPAIVILLLGIAWFGRAVLANGTRNLMKGHRGDLRLTVALIAALLGAASVVDYPLRVPSIQVMIIMLAILLHRSTRNRSACA